MCIDSLLLKFNSAEKQLTQLFISVFDLTASQVTPTVVAPKQLTKLFISVLDLTASRVPPTVVAPLRAGIEITINFSGQPMSVTQHCLNNE